MNHRGMNRFVEIDRMLEKEKAEEEFDFMDFRDDLMYI